MKITFLTLFPEFFDSFKNTSIIQRAIKKGVVEIECINIRDYSKDKNKKVDDITIGGGAGMIMKVEPIVDSINSIKTSNSKVLFLSSKGKTYNQKMAHRLVNEKKDLILLCGHYEGIDERVLDYVDEEISVGDYILTGGEIPSLIVADSIIRLIDGSINEQSVVEESYEDNLLEYPQYTYPKVYDGKEIPEILFSGNHKAIKKWRLKESLKITKKRRNDLLVNRKLTNEEKELLEEIDSNITGKWEIDAIKKSNKIIVHDLKVDADTFNEIIDNKINKFEIDFRAKVNEEICFICGNRYIYKLINNIEINDSKAIVYF